MGVIDRERVMKRLQARRAQMRRTSHWEIPEGEFIANYRLSLPLFQQFVEELHPFLPPWKLDKGISIELKLVRAQRANNYSHEMMYHMKNINKCDDIILPKCMYQMKNPNELTNPDDVDIKIGLQLPNKMAELELRQDQLLKKLDFLYERIKSISSLCKVEVKQNIKADIGNVKQMLTCHEEIVFSVNPDNLPWYMNVLLKSACINVTWHIHSSVPNEKIPKVRAFVNKLAKPTQNDNKLRLIFKSVSADPELRLTSLAVPIVGNVNVLRYLSYVYPNIISYDPSDIYMESLLDLTHLLEKTPEKNRESLSKKIFSQSKNWICNNKFTIVDLAVYNAVKQWQNSSKYVPKPWYVNCEKFFLI